LASARVAPSSAPTRVAHCSCAETHHHDGAGLVEYVVPLLRPPPPPLWPCVRRFPCRYVVCVPCRLFVIVGMPNFAVPPVVHVDHVPRHVYATRRRRQQGRNGRGGGTQQLLRLHRDIHTITTVSVSSSMSCRCGFHHRRRLVRASAHRFSCLYTIARCLGHDR